ncbi:MAG: DUF2225 domain-containing protein [Defluviitaleaceae bacterium]|nr:DUF2225 domain-containing protein [Defluviitaleaceae bacterium]
MDTSFLKTIDMDKLKGHAAAKKFSTGHVISQEGGKKGNEMYVIVEGKIGIYKSMPQEKKIATLTKGDFFGEMTLFLNKDHSATVVAESDVVLLMISRDAVLKFMETQPQLIFAIIQTLCERLDKANLRISGMEIPGTKIEPIPTPPPPAPVAPPAPAAAPEKPELISDKPPEGFTPPPQKKNVIEMPKDLFPPEHDIYNLAPAPKPTELVYKKTFKCPVCDKSFQAYSVRTTRLKVLSRDKDFRSHYQDIDTAYYEIITCTECYFSMLESGFNQHIVARFKENIDKITKYKKNFGSVNLTEDRSINPVFIGYYLALKGAPLFYKNHEMNTAKLWLRLMWLYDDVKDGAMKDFAARSAHAAYLSAFEKTDLTGEGLQQLSVLMGELSLVIKDLPSAKTFFVKARSNKNGNKSLLSQAEDGIETIRRIESGQIKL